ncbi:MAG: magnesium/cobalt efflux protein [Robiginitomaculum sp.]|nr:MAG: magnesium/cobalt efflux protein [Robiginitomaculum sp.]
MPDRKPGLFARLFTSKAGTAPQPDEEAQKLIDNATAFDRVRIEDIMVPRADIVAVSAGASLGELVQAFIQSSHSRLPVYKNTLDDPRGMVHIKDILQFLVPEDGSPVDVNAKILDKITRPVLFAPPSMQADDLMVKMQSTRIHMALVVDEYGGTDGLATLEDLVEQIVGKIEDEHDSEAPSLTRIAEGKWDADARISIEELERTSGLSLIEDDDEDDVDTLGGLVFQLAGRVPQRGEILLHPAGLEFEVMEADPRRIRRLMVRHHHHDE